MQRQASKRHIAVGMSGLLQWTTKHHATRKSVVDSAAEALDRIIRGVFSQPGGRLDIQLDPDCAPEEHMLFEEAVRVYLRNEAAWLNQKNTRLSFEQQLSEGKQAPNSIFSRLTRSTETNTGQHLHFILHGMSVSDLTDQIRRGQVTPSLLAIAMLKAYSSRPQLFLYIGPDAECSRRLKESYDNIPMRQLRQLWIDAESDGIAELLRLERARATTAGE
jgi:hypothetical protein